MSHHLDTPLASQNGQLYLDDLYVFQGNASTVFVMDVNSNVTGATHMPCVFRDLQFVDDIGFRNDGRTFTPSLLESEDPPTLAHFARGRAHAVSLRSLSRVLHVSWAEYAVPEE